VDFLTLFIKTMWCLKMEGFSTPKVLAVGPNQTSTMHARFFVTAGQTNGRT